MMKNIVFDMGKVLVGYDPDVVCKKYIPDSGEIRKKIRDIIFNSQEWVLLDLGVITEEAALKKMLSRLDTDEERQLAEKCFLHWHEYNMWPIPGMKELIQELKNTGYKIYLCSNASVRLRTCYKQVIPGIEFFDGVLFSAEEKLFKPQKEIYLRLFDKFGLKAEECFFIDDLQINIEGGRACGMDGYCFADGDLSKLRERLEELKNEG